MQFSPLFSPLIMSKPSKPEAQVQSYASLRVSCRHIASLDAETDKCRFVVGTAVVGKTNQLQIIEYDDVQNNVSCVQTLSHPDEVWWISCNPDDASQLITVSNHIADRTRNVVLYELPSSTAETGELTEISKFAVPDATSNRVSFLQTNSSKILVSSESAVSIFDIDRPDTPSSLFKPKITAPLKAAAADPLHQNLVAGCSGSDIMVWDLRDQNVAYQIHNAHNPTVLDVAFNENKPWWICSGGMDGNLKCWDVRVGKAACEYRASSHWVTRTLPSASHEQLILTAGTDSKVRVFNASAFAFQNEGELEDGEVIKGVRMDDSVYSACWSSNNPWVFASVSYKGTVNVYQLPTKVVDSILMGDPGSD